MIKSIQLTNFRLFKEANIIPQKINLIEGINLDSGDIPQSSNGSAKSTLVKNAITFCLWGDVPNVNLQKLIHFNEKYTQVMIEIKKDNNVYKIIRRVPSFLQIFLNNEELKFNTSTITQNYINEQFGTYDNFKKFHLIDGKGINLLDLGIISLRKELMNFVDNLFIEIRQSLLNKKLERENFNIDKKLYKFSLSEKRLGILNASLDIIKVEYSNFEKDKSTENGIVNQIKGEIQSRETLIYYKEQDKKKLNKGICPILNNKCSQITEQLDKMNITKNKEIDVLKQEIEQFKKQLEVESDALNYYEGTLKRLLQKERKARECLLKLNEAFKFKEYKYTSKDVMLYGESIKNLDIFAGYYIQEWLDNLSVIINDLLKKVNLSVIITSDKDFMKIKDGENEIDYNLLSDGQQCFLSSVFKLAILLHKGTDLDIVIADDGLNKMDEVSFKKFVEICKTIPYQSFIIFQDVPELEGITRFNIIRENGISRIKEN